MFQLTKALEAKISDLVVKHQPQPALAGLINNGVDLKKDCGSSCSGKCGETCQAACRSSCTGFI